MSPRLCLMLRRFLGDKRGSSAAEFGLLSVLFIGMFLGIIDMGRYAWEFNSAKAATRAGARLAVVSLMLPTYLQSYNALTSCASVTGNGQTVPASCVPTFTCSGATLTCPNAGGLNTAMDTTTFTKILNQMKAYYPRVAAANVVVEYKHVGLGVSGNPYAPDVEPMITVKLTNLQFRPVALRLFGNITFDIPPVRSTLSGESLGA